MRSQVTCKLIFTAPFTALAKPSHFTSSVVTLQGYKVGGRSCVIYILLHDLPPSSRLLPYG
jgi:hypothetical protein